MIIQEDVPWLDIDDDSIELHGDPPTEAIDFVLEWQEDNDANYEMSWCNDHETWRLDCGIPSSPSYWVKGEWKDEDELE